MRTNWDERYKRGEHGNDVPHPLVVRAGTQFPPGRALDVACGSGRHALLLAKLGWQVEAVDGSSVALELLQSRAQAGGLHLETTVADLTRGEYAIASNKYDLVVLTCYLQRDLFPSLCAGVKPGGIAVVVIALQDADPSVKPMNPDFLLRPGELREHFGSWEFVHVAETKSAGRRAMAEIIARRPPE